MTDPTILALSDAGHTPAAISLSTGVPLGTVYATLRQHRPSRPRAPRKRTSDVPRRVLGLHAAGIRPVRIAILVEKSPAYVYRILSEATTHTQES